MKVKYKNGFMLADGFYEAKDEVFPFITMPRRTKLVDKIEDKGETK